MFLVVLFCAALKRRMVRSFLNRLSGTLKKDMIKDEFKRLSQYIHLSDIKKHLCERMKITYRNDRSSFDMLCLAMIMFSSRNEHSFMKTITRANCYWNCWLCGHEFCATKVSVVKGRGHATCSRTLKQSIEKTQLNNSKLSSEQIERRAYSSLVPNQIPDNGTMKLGTKYEFHCSDCSHNFKAVWGNIIKRGAWCPYCNPNNRKLCCNIDCIFCWKNSLAPIFQQNKNLIWLDSNEVKPWEIAAGSRKKVYVSCIVCNHRNQLVGAQCLKNGQGCSYCTHSKLCNDHQCNYCAANSACIYLDRNDISIVSHTSQELRMIAKSNDHIRVKCVCEIDNDHHWETTIGSLALNRGCTLCKNKTEGVVFKQLENTFGKDVVQKHVSFEWCRIIRKLQYDFVVHKIIVELDGIQHTNEVEFFNKQTSFADIQNRDNFKEACAIDNGFSVIRLNQVNVWKNHNKGKTDWLDSLLAAIDTVRTSDEPVLHGYAY